ncbi:MAG: cysteine--tRNA ligase [Elusimicrobiales bacterium]
MKIYNTLSKNIEEIKTVEEGVVKIYTCGPTVYTYAHIGNLRTYIFEDFLVRALMFEGYKVVRVMNITDVGHLTSDNDYGEDKIEIGAKREGKTAWDIARFYTDAFFDDFKELNCIMPDYIPKATEHIKEMIDMIKKLEDKGYTYRTSDGIYFDTSKFPYYYKLVGKSHIEGIKEGARIEFSKEKKNLRDFALWKFSPKNVKRQMEWDSPWGVGFPGWHIECSAMSIKYLGQPFDIHCGGVDHIPIHHTNEIAQAECANDKPFSSYWVHGEFLVLKSSEKMSKSLGNFLTLSSLKENGFSAMDYRYLCAQTHYRKQLEFSFEAMESAKNGYRHLKSSIEELMRAKENTDLELKEINSNPYFIQFSNNISNDLNIPNAIAVLWDMIRDKKLKPSLRIALVERFDEVLGLNLLKEEKIEIPTEIIELVKKRSELRKQKNYTEADRIREMIKQRGYIIQDTPSGPVIKRI